MGIEDLNERKSQNAFGEFVDKPFGNQNSGADVAGNLYGQKKVKLNSEAPLSTLHPSFPLPKQLLTTFFQDNHARTLQFQLFLTTSYSPPLPSTSPPPVYILKVTSASNANDEAEATGNRAEGGVTAVVTETRLVAEGQFLLRSRL